MASMAFLPLAVRRRLPCWHATTGTLGSGTLPAIVQLLDGGTMMGGEPRGPLKQMPRRVYTPDPEPRRRRRSLDPHPAPRWLDRLPPPEPMPAPEKPPPAPKKPRVPTPVQLAEQPVAVNLDAHSVPELPKVKEPRPVPPSAPKVEEPATPRPPPQPKQQVPTWILQVRTLDLLEVATVLGLTVEDDHIRPCPSCGDEAGVAVYRNKKGWFLWRCAACGARDRGNVDLASYALAGEKAGDMGPEQRALLRQWFVDQGWCDASA